MSEILPEPINFQVKNVLTIDGNIMLEEINIPSVSGTNGALYKLIGSNSLYWKTTSGIVNLTAGARITYPLLATNTFGPQYSFSNSNTSGLSLLGNQITLFNNGFPGIVIDNLGNVGIGPLYNPLYKLYINGNTFIGNVLTIKKNIVLQEIIEPSITGTNGTLYKLSNSDALYWKTASGIVNLTAGSSFPLLATTTLTPQYSFSSSNTTGIGYYDDYLYIKIADEQFIQFDQSLNYIKLLKDLNLDNNDIIGVNEINTTDILTSSLNISSYTDTTEIFKIDGFFDIQTSGINYTVGKFNQTYNISDNPIFSTGVILQLNPVINCQGYTNARLTGGIIGIQSRCTLYATDNLTISPISQYIGFNDSGLQFDSNMNGMTIDYAYGIAIIHNSQPSIRNSAINYFYGMFIDEPTDPNIYNKYGVYSNVTNNYLKGITLETSGGTKSNLNYYESNTISLTTSNAWNEIININFIRIGKLINLIFPNNISLKNVFNANLILNILPARLLPSNDVYGLIYGLDNNINITLSYVIKTNGEINIGASSTNTDANFTAGNPVNTGYYGTSITYQCN
jgi:hypothetical protein